LNWEEDEEVAFCCDLRSAIYYLLSIIRVSSRLFAVRKFFIRFGAAGRIALPGEEEKQKAESTVSFSELGKSSVAHLAWTERSGVKAES
jgi:hypothetical protein